MDSLFEPLLTTPRLQELTGDAAWLRAMLRFEAELAAAEAAAGAIPEEAARAIAQACANLNASAAELGREGVASANPVVPLVRALTAATAEPGRGYVHWGATSQDVLDTAAMLVAGEALTEIAVELDGLAGAAAELAARHRSTVMAGRTLLQQAVPTTFGLKAAGWMLAAGGAAERARDFGRERLAVQLGGAAGTLSALGDRGLAVREELARRLGLQEPVLTWHADRSRVAELASVLLLAGGASGKVALDVILLAQTEVGEVGEAIPGGSSTMPQKRNPVAAIEADAAARSLLGPVTVLFGAMRAEHERAAGTWQSEWQALSDGLRLAGGAAARARTSLSGLVVDVERMRANLDLTGGRVMAESVQTALARRLGRAVAHERLEEAARAPDFRAALAAHLDAAELDRALDPASYLGSAEEMVDRALAEHEARRRRRDG